MRGASRGVGVTGGVSQFVQVPPQPAFFEQVNYYRTCLHELTHYAERRIMPHGLFEREIPVDQPCDGSA